MEHNQIIGVFYKRESGASGEKDGRSWANYSDG